jgi:CRISPR-associated protein Cmr3
MTSAHHAHHHARHHCFIEPLDVLFLRGNKLFGAPGSFGESLVPPWPSTAAGALRSLMLVQDGIDPAEFSAGHVPHAVLGTPQSPGPFAVAGFDVARRRSDGTIETVHALPADLVGATDDADPQHRLFVRNLHPVQPAAGLLSSSPLPQWPVLAQNTRSKAEGGLWLTQQGWADYLAGRLPQSNTILKTAELWGFDPRVGIGLDAETGRAADGKLFTVQAVAFRPGVGFLATVQGCDPIKPGTLRLGGDGRGAAMRPVQHQPPQADLVAIAKARRCRVVLTTPGLFESGWQLPGTDGTTQRVRWPGFSARLVSAAVPRAEVISGWDLARQQPKAAQRVAPAGSVYWLDEIDTTPEALSNVAKRGLWLPDAENAQRRAEGFNRCCFAAWSY